MLLWNHARCAAGQLFRAGLKLYTLAATITNMEHFQLLILPNNLKIYGGIEEDICNKNIRRVFKELRSDNKIELDKLVEKYETKEFIKDDPIQFIHQGKTKKKVSF